jgi:hypothetical protein
MPGSIWMALDDCNTLRHRTCSGSLRKFLVACAIAASLIYVSTDIREFDNTCAQLRAPMPAGVMIGPLKN